MLPALGMELVAVENMTALDRYKTQLVRRNEKAVRMLAVYAGRGKHLISKRFLQSIAPLGAQAYLRKVSPERRSAIARNAAIVRWTAAKAAAKGSRS
jgi:hypothetical protein